MPGKLLLDIGDRHAIVGLDQQLLHLMDDVRTVAGVVQAHPQADDMRAARRQGARGRVGPVAERLRNGQDA